MGEYCKQCLGVGEVLTEANQSGAVVSGGFAACQYCLGSGRETLLSHISKRAMTKKDLAIAETVRVTEAQFRRRKHERI